MTPRTVRIDGFGLPADGSDDGTLFAAGSISMAVTGLVALMLVHDGVLELDGDTPTLRQLLAHTSGADWDFVVQSLLEQASGKPFAALAAGRVLEPLGMRDSTFEQPLPVKLHERAAREDWRVYPEAAAAGLWTTPYDLARFAVSVQLALAGRPSPVPQHVAALMVEPQAAIPPSPDFEAIRGLGVAPPEAVGIGLFLSEGGRRFGHLGGAYGFTSALDVSAEEGTGAVVMSDVDNGFLEVLPALATALEGAPVS